MRFLVTFMTVNLPKAEELMDPDNFRSFEKNFFKVTVSDALVSSWDLGSIRNFWSLQWIELPPVIAWLAELLRDLALGGVKGGDILGYLRV